MRFRTFFLLSKIERLAIADLVIITIVIINEQRFLIRLHLLGLKIYKNIYRDSLLERDRERKEFKKKNDRLYQCISHL